MRAVERGLLEMGMVMRRPRRMRWRMMVMMMMVSSLRCLGRTEARVAPRSRMVFHHSRIPGIRLPMIL